MRMVLTVTQKHILDVLIQLSLHVYLMSDPKNSLDDATKWARGLLDRHLPDDVNSADEFQHGMKGWLSSLSEQL